MRGNSLRFRHVAIEDFELDKNEEPFDIAMAIRVGALGSTTGETELVTDVPIFYLGAWLI